MGWVGFEPTLRKELVLQTSAATRICLQPALHGQVVELRWSAVRSDFSPVYTPPKSVAASGRNRRSTSSATSTVRYLRTVGNAILPGPCLSGGSARIRTRTHDFGSTLCYRYTTLPYFHLITHPPGLEPGTSSFRAKRADHYATGVWVERDSNSHVLSEPGLQPGAFTILPPTHLENSELRKVRPHANARKTCATHYSDCQISSLSVTFLANKY